MRTIIPMEVKALLAHEFLLPVCRTLLSPGPHSSALKQYWTECPLNNLLLPVAVMHYNNNGTICTLLMKPPALLYRRRRVYVSASFNSRLFLEKFPLFKNMLSDYLDVGLFFKANPCALKNVIFVMVFIVLEWFFAAPSKVWLRCCVQLSTLVPTSHILWKVETLHVMKVNGRESK